MRIYNDNKVSLLAIMMAALALLVGLPLTSRIEQADPYHSSAIFFLGFALWCIVKGFQEWSIEFDNASQQLRIKTRYLGFLTRTLLECSVRECVAIGAHEQLDAETGKYSSLSILFYDGSRRDLWLGDKSRDGVIKIASQVSQATGIPNRNILQNS